MTDDTRHEVSDDLSDLRTSLLYTLNNQVVNCDAT